jgi:hypothetical protein
MSNLTPKPIVDKNGKATTVHVKNDGATAGKNRAAAVAPQSAYEEDVAPERVGYEEALRRAKAIHPDAKLTLSSGKWEISIDLDIQEDMTTLPARFDGTPAAEALANEHYSGWRNELEDWSEQAYSRNMPLEIVAESYNATYKLRSIQREWTNKQLTDRGLRTYEQITEVARDDFGSITDEERAYYLEDFNRDGKSRGAAYAREATKEDFARLSAMEDAYYEA